MPVTDNDTPMKLIYTPAQRREYETQQSLFC